MSNVSDVAPPTPCTATLPTAALMKWQRLTILDLLLLMLSYGVSGSICTWDYDENAMQQADPWTSPTTKMDIFLSIVVVGNNLAAPFVLTTQYVFRHRRTWLSVGEWLWLVPLAMYLTILSVPMHSRLLFLGLFEGILVLCSVLAIGCLICRAFGYWETATCRWTDVFGALTCPSTGALLAYELIVHPIII